MELDKETNRRGRDTKVQLIRSGISRFSRIMQISSIGNICNPVRVMYGRGIIVRPNVRRDHCDDQN